MARHAKHEVAPRRRHSSRRSPSRGTVTLRALGVLLATGVALLCLGFFQGERVRDPVLPTVLPDALRSVSSSLLTDLTALDYAALERTLEFLANNTAAVEAQTLPGDWDAVGGTYTLNEASLAAVQAFFNASPTDAQASSASEP